MKEPIGKEPFIQSGHKEIPPPNTLLISNSMKTTHKTSPFILTIFGASGDLAKLKIFPSIYYLIEQNKLPKEFYIIGYARTKKSRKEFQSEFELSIRKQLKEKVNEELIEKVLNRVFYFVGQYDNVEHFKRFKKFTKDITKEAKIPHLVYFSVPPTVFKKIIQNLGETKNSKTEDIRLILEKPFGEDEHSARELFHFVARYFEEQQIYLLDHYLGKSAVQSLLSLRHHNRLLNLILQGGVVANIQISAFEDIGVKNRIGYFDTVGTLKDMVQSHLLQIAALITMSIPITVSAESLHREKYNILSSMKFPIRDKSIVLGQYTTYQSTPGVEKNSKTETFVAARLFIDREKWYKVPIYIRTGKKLHKKHTFIVIELKKIAFQRKNDPPNRIVIELQPQEKISIKLLNPMENHSHYIDLTSSETITCPEDDCLPEHSILLLDAISGNKKKFLSFPEVLATWKITDDIIRWVKRKKFQIEKYKDYSEGPAGQNDLPKMDRFEWYNVTQ